MRIAMVAACPFPSPQGSQVLVGQLCERLSGRGHEVHLLTYGHGHGHPAGAFAHHRIRRLPGDDAMRSGPTWVKPALDAMMVASLDRLVAERRFDLLHCHNYEAAIIGLAVRARRKVPVVYHSHNLMADELGTYFRSPVSRAAAGVAGRWLDRYVPRRVDHAIALCRYSARILEENGVAPGRISVIPPAVDDSGPPPPKADARRMLRIAGDGPVVGYCGNLDAYQNLDMLLAALQDLRTGSAPTPVRLLVATHAPDRSFERAIAARGLTAAVTVRCVASFEEAMAAMAAADMVVLPRRRGSGYPIKLLNYMSLGCAIITAGCGAKNVRDGVDAVVVPDDDPAALAAAVRMLAADRAFAQRIGRMARTRFLRTLSWDCVLPAVEAVYARVLPSTGAPSMARAI